MGSTHLDWTSKYGTAVILGASVPSGVVGALTPGTSNYAAFDGMKKKELGTNVLAPAEADFSPPPPPSGGPRIHETKSDQHGVHYPLKSIIVLLRQT